ncbi:MAG: hypothetical protein JWN42_2247 [Candidatus Angelobacter sp.]|nr:hypothetical protein [Candidatus Angelobacter sp.]
MNRQLASSATSVLKYPLLRSRFAPLILLAWLAGTANGQSRVETSAASSSIHVKHILGFEGVRRNASGQLSIQDGGLRFQQDGKPPAQVSITSIHNISLGEEDNQVGGLPMMLGKTAVPFGGGRVVSLFSHKKYDSLAIEYLDSNGGFHGAIFRLTKGQGETVKSDLVARGSQVTPSEDPGPIRATSEESLKAAEEWSVQIARIDPGATTLDPSFSDAIYENLLKELPRSKQFKHVFRSGDRNANDASGVLVLKTFVEKYSPGSETRRAVTTVAGATKLRVHIQLLTGDSRVVLEHTVDGNVRFLGDNLGATNKVARNAAKILKRSPLPQPATPIAQQSTGKSHTMSFMSQSQLATNVLLRKWSARSAA